MSNAQSHVTTLFQLEDRPIGQTDKRFDSDGSYGRREEYVGLKEKDGEQRKGLRSAEYRLKCVGMRSVNDWTNQNARQKIHDCQIWSDDLPPSYCTVSAEVIHEPLTLTSCVPMRLSL
jgi:hypothetical protein